MKSDKVQQITTPPLIPQNSPFNLFFKAFNFEFMDLNFMPPSLRSVLRDILEVGNGFPFRNYYQWVSASVYNYAKKNGINEIVELGAGCAPITKHLIKNYSNWDAHFKITDLNPDTITFKAIEQSDKRVVAICEPLDFTKKIAGLENAILVLSATFHHVDEKQKKHILNSLKKQSSHIMIFEPLRPTAFSLFFVTGALFSGFLTPFFKMNSKKFFRTFFWCWLAPIAPFLFLWDGWVSALRCWNKKDWQSQAPSSKIEETFFCTKVTFK